MSGRAELLDVYRAVFIAVKMYLEFQALPGVKRSSISVVVVLETLSESFRYGKHASMISSEKEP